MNNQKFNLTQVACLSLFASFLVGVLAIQIGIQTFASSSASVGSSTSISSVSSITSTSSSSASSVNCSAQPNHPDCAGSSSSTSIASVNCSAQPNHPDCAGSSSSTSIVGINCNAQPNHPDCAGTSSVTSIVGINCNAQPNHPDCTGSSSSASAVAGGVVSSVTTTTTATTSAPTQNDNTPSAFFQSILSIIRAALTVPPTDVKPDAGNPSATAPTFDTADGATGVDETVVQEQINAIQGSAESGLQAEVAAQPVHAAAPAQTIESTAFAMLGAVTYSLFIQPFVTLFMMVFGG